MKARVKVYGWIMLTLAAAVAVVGYAYNELSAIAWHVRHGFHTEIAGTRLLVPLSYEAEDPHGLPALSITKLPGHFPSAGGFILIDLRIVQSAEPVKGKS